MKKVIYLMLMLVVSMSIVSCEKDDPKGKKDKEEQKEEQPVEKTKYVLLDSVKVFNNGYYQRGWDTIYVYKEDLSLDYITVGKENVERKYYNEHNDIVKWSIYNTVNDVEAVFTYTYDYENGRKVSRQAFFDNQKVEDRTYTYNEEGYIIKEEASNVIEFKYNGTRGFIKYDYVRNNFREDEYGNYVCDRSDIYESDIYEDETINYIELLIPNAQNEYNEDGLLISKSYIDCYGENYKLEYIYKEYYK